MALTDTTSGVVYASGQPYYDWVLTNFMRSEMPDARNNSTVLLSMIDKQSKEAVSGRFIIWDVRYGRSTGLGNMGYNGKMASPTSQNFRSMVTLTRTGMARIALDGPTLRHAKTNGGAFTDPMRVEAEGIVDDVMVDRARQVHNDGSGRLGEVSAVTGTTATVTIKGNSSIEGATNKKWSGTLETYFEPGTRVCFIANDGTPTIRTPYTGQQAAYVVSATANGNNIDVVFSSSFGGSSTNFNTNPTAGDWIVRCADNTVSSYIDSAWRNELTGFGAILSDAGVLDGVGTVAAQHATSSSTTDYTSTSVTNFQGQSSSTFSWNKGIVLDNGGSGNRPLTETLMQSALSDAERLNNANITIIMSSFPTYDFFVNTAIGDKRYTNTLTLETGHKVLTFNGLGWVKDRMAYQNEVMFLGLDQVHMIETQAFSDLAIEDVTTWKQVQDIDRYWRGWVWEDQIITDIRQRAGARLTELTA